MHFKKPRVSAAMLTVLMLILFLILFIVNIAASLASSQGEGAPSDLEAAVTDTLSAPESDGADSAVSVPAAVTYGQVFENGFTVRRIDSNKPPQLPEGSGAVIEETHDVSFDLSSSDGIVRITDKSLSGAQIDVDAVETRYEPQSGTPTVVIYHTHTTEGYAQKLDLYYPLQSDGMAKSESTSVVAAGSTLKNELERLGINAVHITDTFDSPSRSGSFARSKAALKKELEKLDRVDLVIDLHRGVIQQTGGARVKPTVYLNGYRAAQIRLKTAYGERGELQKQLAAALTLQRRLAYISPLLCMPVSLESQTYNFDISAPAVMIEIGTDRNTVSEAKLTAAVLAQAVWEMLTEE